MADNNVLKGIIAPMITPLTGPDELDKEGVLNLVEHLIQGGVSGIFILGITGEAQHLSSAVKNEMIRTTCAAVDKRVPVLVGVTDSAAYESFNVVIEAWLNKADAVVAAPPYFFPLEQPELIDYYETLAKFSDLPVCLYNMPAQTKTNIELDTVRQLSRNKNIVGLIDSSANAIYLNKLLYVLKDNSGFGLYVGPEEMMASAVLMGVDGGMPGGANLYPHIFVELYQAAAEKDVDKVRLLQNKMISISMELYNIGKYSTGYIKGLKAALSLKGICRDTMAQPCRALTQYERDKVADAIRRIEYMIYRNE